MWETPHDYPVKCSTPMDSVLADIFTSFCPLPYNRQFLCQTFLFPCIKQPGICPREECIREGRGSERMGHRAV